MRELMNETILGAMISELAGMTDNTVTEFLSKYEKLFGKYVDFVKLTINDQIYKIVQYYATKTKTSAK